MKALQFKTVAVFMIITVIFTSCKNNSTNHSTDLARQQLVAAEPESVGFSSERLARIDTVVNDYIERECFPGAVALIARHGKIVYYKSFGMRDLAAQDPMEHDEPTIWLQCH